MHDATLKVGTLFWNTLSFFLQSNDIDHYILEAFHKLNSYITLALQNLSVNNESNNFDQTSLGMNTNPIQRDTGPYNRTRFCVDCILTTHASHNLCQGKKMTCLSTSLYSQKGLFCYTRGILNKFLTPNLKYLSVIAKHVVISAPRNSLLFNVEKFYVLTPCSGVTLI